MKILYTAILNKDKSFEKIKKGTVINVTSDLGPGSMTGSDPFVQGWAIMPDGKEKYVTVGYSDVTRTTRP